MWELKRPGKVWKWKLPFVSMLITSCSQHSTPNHLVSLLGSRLARRSGPGSESSGGGSARPGQPGEGPERVCGKFSGPQGRLGSFRFEIKSSPASREGGGGFAQSLGTAGLGGGTGSEVDGQRSAGTREEQLGFPERGPAVQPGQAGRIAPVPRSSPRAGLGLARLAAPLPAAPRSAPPGPARAALPGPARLPPARARTQAGPQRKLLTRG